MHEAFMLFLIFCFDFLVAALPNLTHSVCMSDDRLKTLGAPSQSVGNFSTETISTHNLAILGFGLMEPGELFFHIETPREIRPPDDEDTGHLHHVRSEEVKSTANCPLEPHNGIAMQLVEVSLPTRELVTPNKIRRLLKVVKLVRRAACLTSESIMQRAND